MKSERYQNIHNNFKIMMVIFYNEFQYSTLRDSILDLYSRINKNININDDVLLRTLSATEREIIQTGVLKRNPVEPPPIRSRT